MFACANQKAFPLCLWVLAVATLASCQQVRHVCAPEFFGEDSSMTRAIAYVTPNLDQGWYVLSSSFMVVRAGVPSYSLQLHVVLRHGIKASLQRLDLNLHVVPH